MQGTRRRLLGLRDDEALEPPKPLPPRPPSERHEDDASFAGMGVTSMALGKFKKKLALSRIERDKLLVVIEAIERWGVGVRWRARLAV